MVSIIKFIFYISTDINECDNFNGDCDQICTNFAGSYTCSCQEGYVLNLDHQNCTGILHKLK